MTSNKSISITLCLALFALASTLYLLMLGWNNALALDDYGYVSLVEKHGVWGMMSIAYHGWQCRFSTFLVNGLILLMFGRAKNLVGVTILMLLLGWGTTCLLFSGINRKYNLGIPIPIVGLVSIITVNVGVVSFLEPATFFWLCALNYTISIWMTLLLIYALFFCNGNNAIRWVLTVVSSLYISGTAENYTPLVILVLGIVWLVRLLYLKLKTSQQKEVNTMLLASLIIMGAGFLVMLYGPGNKNRLASLSEESMAIASLKFSQIILKTVKGSAILLLRELSRLQFFLITFPVFYEIGALYCNNRQSQMTIAHAGLVIALFVLFVIISVAACVVGIGWYAPPRAFSYMSFVMMGVCAYLGVRLGARHHYKKRVVPRSALIFFSLVGTLVFTAMIARDKPIVEDYHGYITSRNESIQSRKENVNKGVETNEAPYVCEPYEPKWRINTYSSLRNLVNSCLGKSKRYYEPQVILMESTLSEDPDDWRNRGVQNYYHAGFDIVCFDSK